MMGFGYCGCMKITLPASENVLRHSFGPFSDILRLQICHHCLISDLSAVVRCLHTEVASCDAL